MAFVAHSETGLDYYKRQTFHYLNIYEAYFENCAYNYVLEFFLQDQEAKFARPIKSQARCRGSAL